MKGRFNVETYSRIQNGFPVDGIVEDWSRNGTYIWSTWVLYVDDQNKITRNHVDQILGD